MAILVVYIEAMARVDLMHRVDLQWETTYPLQAAVTHAKGFDPKSPMCWKVYENQHLYAHATKVTPNKVSFVVKTKIFVGPRVKQFGFIKRFIKSF